MRKEWVHPQLMLQQFVPNEYVSACGDSGTVYKFECNAGDLGLEDYPYRVYVDYNGTGNYRYRNNYHACGAKHEAASDSGFYKGYMDDERTTGNDNIQVIVWTDHNRDTHCTTVLDKSQWETAKS